MIHEIIMKHIRIRPLIPSRWWTNIFSVKSRGDILFSFPGGYTLLTLSIGTSSSEPQPWIKQVEHVYAQNKASLYHMMFKAYL